MSIQGTNSHPYLTMDDAVVNERNMGQCIGPGPEGWPNVVPSAREIMEQMQRDMQTKYGKPPNMDTHGEKPKGTLDIQYGGDHYKKMPIQPWELIDAMYPGIKGEAFYVGTAMAYFMRWKEKGGLLDLKKGIHTLEHFIENMEKAA